jgi:hypothetical protein
MVALPHIPIGAPDCVADELRVFNGLPVLWAFRPVLELPPSQTYEPAPFDPEPVSCKSSFAMRRGRLMVDDEDLEEPMFRRPKVVLPSTNAKLATTFQSVRARPAAAAGQVSTSGSRLVPRPPASQVRPARPIAPTSRPTTTSRPSIPSARLLAHKSSTLSLNRSTKPASALPLRPVQDLSHLMPDLPEVEISLDFDL